MRHLPKYFLVVILAALLLNVAAAVTPDEMQGRIVSVDPDGFEFVLHVRNDRMVTFQMDEDAQVYVNDVEASLADLLPDDFVTVNYRQDADHFYAIEVRCERR